MSYCDITLAILTLYSVGVSFWVIVLDNRVQDLEGYIDRIDRGKL